VQRRNVPVLALTVIAMLVARLTWSRLLPTYYADLGASDAQIGTAFSLLAAAFALFQLIGGLLADRVGRKPVTVLPIFGVVVAVAGMARVGNWQQLLAAHLSLAAFASVQSPGFTALLAESVPAGERGRAFGMVTVASRIASAAGPALGAWLLTLTALPTLLWGTVAVGVVVSLARLSLLRETLGTAGSSAPLSAAWGEVDWGTAARFLVVGTLYTLFFNLLLGGPFIALHAHQIRGLDNVRLNLLFAVGDGAAILSAPLAGWLGDRVGHRRMLAAAVLVMGGGLLAWALLPGGWAATLCFVLATGAGPAASIAYNALLTGVVEGRRRGSFVGLMGTLTGLLGSPASRVGAELRVWGGSSGPFWAALGLAGLLVLALGWGGTKEGRSAGN